MTSQCSEHCAKIGISQREVSTNSPAVEISLDGVQSYVVGTNTKSCLVFGTDIWGWNFLNTRNTAKILEAATGITCIIPDIFNNDEVPRLPLAELMKSIIPVTIKNKRIVIKHQ